MDPEILKNLLESDLLSEEAKKEITAKFTSAVESFLAEERSKLEVEIRTALTEEFVKAREELAEAVNTKVDELLAKEFDELKEDINKFRDLEVEFAEKLVEEKEALAQTLGEQLDQLVDKLDAFLEVRLDEEMTELKEDISDVKKLEFGRKIFEAVEAEFKKFRKSELTEAEQEFAEMQDRLEDAQRRLSEIESERLAEARSSKMEELLSPLSGNAREQMKIILSNVPTEKLEESYKIYIGRILKESVELKKEDKVIVETKKIDAAPAKIVTGNDETEESVKPLVETVKPNQLTNRLRELAGVTRTQ